MVQQAAPSGLKTSIGIDATNLRLGGGVTHLRELLGALKPVDLGINTIHVWGGSQTLAQLPERPWLFKINPPALNSGLWQRILWQTFSLAKAVRAAGCDVLFVPGGSYVAHFSPVVTMSQNLLPFEWSEIKRNGWSLRTVKMLALRWVQSYSFRRSEGVIFLSEYAKKAVWRVTGPLIGKCEIIPHGLSPLFSGLKSRSSAKKEYSKQDPYRLIYVSNIEAYKHQAEVIEAVFTLRQKGYPLALQLIGPSIPSGIDLLEKSMKKFDPKGAWVEYLGLIAYEDLRAHYENADIAIFASSCETFGIILLEKMAIGLPIACSQLSGLPDLLGEAGLYFDPTKVVDIVKVLERYLASPQLRAQKGELGRLRAQEYSWNKCAQTTFTFLCSIANSKAD